MTCCLVTVFLREYILHNFTTEGQLNLPTADGSIKSAPKFVCHLFLDIFFTGIFGGGAGIVFCKAKSANYFVPGKIEYCVANTTILRYNNLTSFGSFQFFYYS